MNIRRFFMGRAIGFLVVLGITGIVAGFFALNNYIYTEKQSNGVVEPYRATLSGEYVCLPRAAGASQTEECTNGLKTDAGEYYAVDFMLMSQTHEPLITGQRFSASGMVHPVELLSSDHWQNYAIEGIFSVTDALVVEN